MKRGGQRSLDGKADGLAANVAVLRAAGVEVTADYLLALIKIDEAAQFLGTTKGELYHLTHRREIPFIAWGKRGLRFRRMDLIPWMEERRKLTWSRGATE